jgi:AbrB family looped-hinge helix DNA binding protein
MKTRVTRRHQITIPEEIRKKAKISVGDNLEISYKHGKILVEKIGDNWGNVMKETKGAWRKHPVFKNMGGAVEIVAGCVERNEERILLDFMIGAHAEQHSDALITWNPSDYNINIEVLTPSEVIEAEQ